MTSAVFTQLDEQTLRERYALLCQVCESTSTDGSKQLEHRLQALEQIIEQELPTLARKGSPDNVTDLLQALRLEMIRFREFCEYPGLPSKVVVGLGGSFSAGKSSLINALIGDRQCLVTEVDPTTSLPTYLVQGKGEQTEVQAINLFNRMVPLSHDQFRTLTHEEKSLYGSQVSTLLKSVVVAHPALPWGNLALLDTPGYSKADEVGSERTDANLARAQLNSAQFIVWLVPADKGTITEEDIAFLATLDRAIPKLIVLSRADKHPPEQIEKIVALVRDTLAKRGLDVLDVIPFSNRPRAAYNAEPLLDYFAQWEQANRDLGFAQQFKRQFMAYQDFIDVARQEAQLRLGKFNRILTLSDDSEVQEDIDNLQRKSKAELAQLEQLAEALAGVQLRFFTQLKQIGDGVGIPLPEPDAMSLLKFEPSHLSQRLQQLVDEGSGVAMACDPLLWLPLMKNQALTDVDITALGDRHYVAQQDEVTRCRYAALLLMALLEKGVISEPQQRMLVRWLRALKLAGRQAELCILAGRLKQDQLGEAIALLKQDGPLLRSLLLDIMIFSRLDQPLSDDPIALLETLAGYLKEDPSWYPWAAARKEKNKVNYEQEISNIVYLAAFILGLPTDPLSEPHVDMDLSPYQVWDEFLYHYKPNAARRLFKWADKNKVPDSQLPRNINDLPNVKKLSNLDNENPKCWRQLPDELYLLSGLKELEAFVHTTPENIGKFKNLKSLTIDAPASQHIPESIGELHNLEKLILRGGFNKFPEKLSELSRLKFLHIDSPNLSEAPKVIGKLRALVHLELTDECKTLPKELCELNALKSLTINESFTSRYFTKLEKPNLSSNEIFRQTFASGGALLGVIYGWNEADGWFYTTVASCIGFFAGAIVGLLVALIVAIIGENAWYYTRRRIYLNNFNVPKELVDFIKRNNIELDVPKSMKPLFSLWTHNSSEK